jgi:hypothetical protein
MVETVIARVCLLAKFQINNTNHEPPSVVSHDTPTNPSSVSTLHQRRHKRTVADPSNSFCGDAAVSVEPTLLNRPVTGADRMGSEQVS